MVLGVDAGINEVRLMGSRCSRPGRSGKATLKATLSSRLPPGTVEWPEWPPSDTWLFVSQPEGLP